MIGNEILWRNGQIKKTQKYAGFYWTHLQEFWLTGHYKPIFVHIYSHTLWSSLSTFNPSIEKGRLAKDFSSTTRHNNFTQLSVLSRTRIFLFCYQSPKKKEKAILVWMHNTVSACWSAREVDWLIAPPEKRW